MGSPEKRGAEEPPQGVAELEAELRESRRQLGAAEEKLRQALTTRQTLERALEEIEERHRQATDRLRSDLALAREIHPAGELFGFGHLEDQIRTGPVGSTEGMLDDLKAAVASFVAGQDPHDDITIVVLRT